MKVGELMFGLYIHVPFCVKKCNYCDFNSFKVDRISKNTYLEDLKKEMELYKSEIDENEEITSIFLGGGTPSILSGDESCRQILCSCQQVWIHNR